MSGYAGRRVLVTGADGFIGSHLFERLLADGAEVRALCQYNSNSSLGWLDTIDPDGLASADIRLGDIRDAGFVRSLLDDVDTVFHLAALIAIPFSYVAPNSFVETNVVGTLNVLEAARAHQTPRVVNTSTSEVYGTPATTPITVDHPLQAQSPYAATKVAADQLCHAYAMSFGVNVATLRPFNTFGPRQSLRAIIPTILAQMLAGADTITLGSLAPRRDFTFVTDTVDGFVRIGTAPTEPGTVIQLGTGVAPSIAELVELCREVTGSEAVVVTDDQRIRPEASEVQHLLSDPSEALRLLGWRPTTELDDGLRRTAEWLEGSPMLERAAHYHR